MGGADPEAQNDSRAAERASADVAQNERLLRTIIDAVPHYIYVKDAAGRFTLGNKAWLDSRAMPLDAVIGKTVHDLFPPSVAERMERQDREVLESGSPVLDAEHRVNIVGPDGSRVERWWSTTKVPLRGAGGAIIGLVGISRDVTEHKDTEESLNRERTMLRTIIDALPDYIYVKDRQGRFQLGNRAWLDARQLRLDEVEGRTVLDIFPLPIATRLHEQDQAVIESGKAVLDREQPIVLRDQSEASRRWSATSKVPISDEQGTIIGIVGISRDITERRRLERERAMQHAIAQLLSESRSVAETMPRLIRTICEAMEWVYGARWIWDPAKSNLRRAEWWCEEEPRFDPSDESYWRELGLPHAGGLLRRAWLEQHATWLADLEGVETFRRKPSCSKFGWRSAFAFPVSADDEKLGVMEFFGRDVREPDTLLLQVSGALANQIGQFIRRKQAEEALQESEQQLRAMFEHAEVGIAITGLDMRYMRVNDKFCAIVGYTREELAHMRTSDVNLEDNIGRMLEQRARLLRQDVPVTTVEKQLVRKDGELVWVSIAISLVRSSDGAPLYYLAVVQDISETKRAAAALKESEAQFRRLAQYDSLTGLPNRTLFSDRLQHALLQAKRTRCALAVLFIDVDRFKNVNDTFGHAAGDALLKCMSERLTGCVRSEDTVGRLSGDEFAIVLSRLTAPEDAATVARKIVEALNRPFQLEGAEIFVTASIGITVAPTDGDDQDALLGNADVAMYQAKDRGRNNFQFYTSEMNRRTREMLSLESELRRALERGEFVVHYQPKVHLVTRGITGLEALLRWQHPERGLVPPGAFMPLLEETGLVVQAGEWVLAAVCRQLREWTRAGVPRVPVAINLSARQFLAPDLAASVQQMLDAAGTSAALIELELTESSIMTNPEEAVRTLERLDAMGLAIAVDDFGTGYSSLSYLKRFPIRALKVDRSFVANITADPNDATITQAIISLAHSLGIKVVAEGVETTAQLATLMRYGCDEVQGYLLARPMPADACARLLADTGGIAHVLEEAALGA